MDCAVGNHGDIYICVFLTTMRSIRRLELTLRMRTLNLTKSLSEQEEIYLAFAVAKGEVMNAKFDARESPT